MTLWDKVKEIARKMLPKKSITDVLQTNPITSDKMSEAILLWANMYTGHSPWLKEPTYEDPTRIASLGLPAFIASEKARMATLEMKTEISAPMIDVDVNDAQDLAGESSSTGTENVTSNQNAEAKPALGAGNSTETPQGLPADLMANTAYQEQTKQVPAGPTERAEFLNSQYKKLTRQIRRQLEYGIAKGGLVIKPYVVLYDDVKTATGTDTTQKSAFGEQPNTAKNKQTANTANASNDESVKSSKNRLVYSGKLPPAEIEFDFVQADRFFPLVFDATGKVIEAAFVQTKVDKARERVYIRLEYHKLERRRVTVENLAFESTDMNLAETSYILRAQDIGNPIPLSAVPEWATLQPKTIIVNVDRLLFAYFRMPEANTVDPYSPLGVSGYSRVVSLIKDADRQYSRMLWEFEGGELAIDVDRDALKFVTDPTSAGGEGHSVLPMQQQRLFRKVDLNAEDTYEVFAPPLRDVSIIHGLNTILTKIEDNTGLSRGTLSDITMQEAKTATELKILKQRSYATNADIQAALQTALEDAVYVMDVYSTLYEVTPPGEYEISFEWDDSIIVDNESELSKRITLMQNGLASKLENRMWYFGETENQAKAAMRQIDAEARQTTLQNVEADMLKAQAFNNQGESDTTSKKISSGKQADSLDNPDKSKTADAIKGTE